jgi:hypothetical protein
MVYYSTLLSIGDALVEERSSEIESHVFIDSAPIAGTKHSLADASSPGAGRPRTLIG